MLSNTIRSLAAMAALLLSSSVFANATGTDFQAFNPTTSGLDFVTVHSSETLEPGVFNLGLFFHYAINALPEFTDDKASRAGRGRIRNAILSSDLNLGFGLTQNWDIGVSMPATLNQDIRTEKSRLQFAEKGVNEVRLNTKYRLWGKSDYGVAAIASVNFNTIEDNPYLGEDAGPIYNAEIAADTTVSRVALAANLGYRARSKGDRIPQFPAEPFGDQYVWSTAASYLFPSVDTKMILEIFGALPATDSDKELRKLQNTSEALLGMKHDIRSDIALHAGATTHLNKTAASPDYRVYLGLNMNFGGSPEEIPEAEPVVDSESTTPPVTKSPRVLVPRQMAGEDPRRVQRYVVRGIHFGFDSSRLVSKKSIRSMDLVAERVNGLPKYKRVTVEGHTDSVGSEGYNQQLSQARAEQVLEYLTRVHKIPADKINAIGYGETRPVADNGNYQGRQKNRRVEIRIELN